MYQILGESKKIHFQKRPKSPDSKKYVLEKYGIFKIWKILNLKHFL